MAWEDRDYNNEQYSSGGGVPRLIFPMPSWLTLSLIVSNLAIFLLGGFTGYRGFDWLVLRFPEAHPVTQPWRWITYQYVHGGGLHIFFNLIAIYFFVPMVERLWGWPKALVFYTVGGIAAGATACLLSLIMGWPLVLLGASGSILALLGAVTYIMPNTQILAMMVVPITMRTFAILVTILYCLMIVGDHSLADAAHLGGLAFGFFTMMFVGERLNLLGREAWQVSQKTPWHSKFGGSDSRRKQVEKLRQAEREEQQRIDEILAKVSASGMQSLNYLEKRALKKATENQRKRELELSKLR